MSGKATIVLDIREILRRLRAGQNDSQTQRDLGLNRRTIQKYRRWAQTEGFLERPELADAEELNRRLQAILHQPPPETPSKAAPYPPPTRATAQVWLAGWTGGAPKGCLPSRLA